MFVFSEQPPQHTLKCISPCRPAPQWGRGSAVWPRSTLFALSERGDYLSGAKQVPEDSSDVQSQLKTSCTAATLMAKDKGDDGFKKRAHCTGEMEGKLVFLFPAHVSW